MVAYCYAKINRMMQSASVPYKERGLPKLLGQNVGWGWGGGGGLEGGGFRWSVSQYWSNSLLFIAISYHTTYFILTNQVNNQAIIPSTDVIQLTLTLDYRTGCRNVSHYQQPWTKFTRTIKLNLILKWLLGSNLSQLYFILLSQWYWLILNEDMNVAVGLAI